MTATGKSRTVLPPADGVLADLVAALGEADVALVGAGGVRVPLPQEVRQVLTSVVAAMADGLAVSIEAHHTQLTVQEAAELLGVDRPRLVRLLDHGTIPFEHRGRQRVVQLADVIDYQERVRAARRADLDELTRSAGQPGAK